MAQGPSEKTLREWLRLEPAQSRQLKKAMIAARSDRAMEDVMALADKLMNAYGVEAITGDYYVDGFYQDIVASYVNTGDTYNATLLHESETGRFIATSWGDWVERNERRYSIR